MKKETCPEETRRMKKIKEEVVACQKCSLYKTRILPVIGQGSHDAKIMFIGEAPGASEDKTGVPFCGRAGNVLDELLASAGIKREDVYIANILKCRPPSNRNPEGKEIEACVAHLEKQIEIIKAKMLCLLGNYATGYILKKYGLEDKIQGISQIHGQVFPAGDLKLIPLYHPAVTVYNINMKSVLKEDFKLLARI